MNDLELNIERDIVKMLTQIGNAEAQAIRESNYPAYVDLVALHMMVMHYYDNPQEALDYAVKMWGNINVD